MTSYVPLGSQTTLAGTIVHLCMAVSPNPINCQFETTLGKDPLQLHQISTGRQLIGSCTAIAIPLLDDGSASVSLLQPLTAMALRLFLFSLTAMALRLFLFCNHSQRWLTVCLQAFEDRVCVDHLPSCPPCRRVPGSLKVLCNQSYALSAH